MHIKRWSTEGDEFISWCNERVDRERALSVDNALKSIERKRGEYPCHACLLEISKACTEHAQPSLNADGAKTQEKSVCPICGEPEYCITNRPMRRHVLKTGHRVTIESGRATYYTLTTNT